MNAGINNQKFALLGLIHRCVAEKCDIAIPRIVDFVAEDSALHTYEFAKLFDDEPLKAVLWDRRIGLAADGEALESWDCFIEGTYIVDRLRGRDLFARIMVQEIARCFVPRDAAAIRAAIPSSAFDAVVQLRVETDWAAYIAREMSDRSAPGENLTTDPMQILRQVRDECPGATRLYICLDEGGAGFALDALRQSARDELGLSLCFKTDFIRDPLTLASNAKRSLIDFEIASTASLFVGTSRSTFSNLAALTAVTGGVPDRIDYLYNASTIGLARRIDGGTAADPRTAQTLDLAGWLAED